jgi:hypothetical protein
MIKITTKVIQRKGKKEYEEWRITTFKILFIPILIIEDKI